jgi:hypothetical protein
MTLLEHIRKCPQIFSVHFSCASPSNDARLGYLTGNFPSSVQFLSFSNALSSESVETLCILLRNNNAAFSGTIDDLQWKQPLVEDAQVGLLGLAITNQTLDAKCLASIATLLVSLDHDNDGLANLGPSSNDLVRSNGLDPDSDTVPHPLLYIPSIPQCRGLKYLDLSSNRLTDTVCADLIAYVSHTVHLWMSRTYDHLAKYMYCV